MKSKLLIYKLTSVRGIRPLIMKVAKLPHPLQLLEKKLAVKVTINKKLLCHVCLKKVYQASLDLI